MYLLENPNGNPTNDVQTAWRQYIKFQLTGTELHCWKYSTLCEWVGKPKAGQFLGDYISLIRRLPTQAEYDTYTAELIGYYENIGQADSGSYILTSADTALFSAAVDNFFGWTPAWAEERGEETAEDSGDDGTVKLVLGRARYVFGGHNWARGEAVPKDGADVTMEATFRNENGNGTLRQEVTKDRTRANQALITGPHSAGFSLAVAGNGARFKTLDGSATSHGDTETGEACWRAVPLGPISGCSGPVP